MWQAHRDAYLALSQAYAFSKDEENTNLIDYHYETVHHMWLNLTRVQILYIWYFLKK